MTNWEAIAELQKARVDAGIETYCLHPSASPRTCSNVIARAHSVQWS